jgi:rhomboid protease GluP
MLNDPPPQKSQPHPLEQSPEQPTSDKPEIPVKPNRRPHPLEMRPEQPSAAAPREQGMLHIPSVYAYVTYALVAINVALFVIGYLSPLVDYDLKTWGVNIPRQVLSWGEYHRLFTSMFLHGNIAHVVFNVMVLYSFGGPLESIIGHVRFALIYFLGGLAASVLSTVMHMSSNVGSLGASGAVFAVLGAEYVFLYRHRKLLGVRGQARRRSLIFWGVMNLVLGFLANISGGPILIDNWGHIGGLVGGLVLAWQISPNFIFRRHPYYTDQNVFIAVDLNPLKQKYWAISLYAAALITILISAALFVRR